MATWCDTAAQMLHLDLVSLQNAVGAPAYITSLYITFIEVCDVN